MSEGRAEAREKLESGRKLGEELEETGTEPPRATGKGLKEAGVKSRETAEEKREEVKAPAKIEEEPERSKPLDLQKPPLPRLPTLHPKIELTTKIAEPRVPSISSELLTDRQRLFISVLYRLMSERGIGDLIEIGKALGMRAEDVLEELNALENQGLVEVSSGRVRLTPKGEALAVSIAVDEGLLVKLRDVLVKVPRAPLIHVPRIVAKPVDREDYSARVVAPRTVREPPVPAFPRLSAGGIALRGLDKSASPPSFPSRGPAVVPVPRIPQLSLPGARARAFDKRPLTAEAVEEKPREVVAGIEKPAKRRAARMPSSLLTALFTLLPPEWLMPGAPRGLREEYSAKGLLSAAYERPVIVVAVKRSSEEYIGALISVLAEVYRMKAGGLPVGRYAGAAGEKHIVEEELVRRGLLKVVDDAKADFLEFFGISSAEEFSKVDVSKLSHRIIESSTQGPSFLVFYINKDKAPQLLTYLASLKKLIKHKLVILYPRRLSEEQKAELSRLSWGFVDPLEPLYEGTIDEHFVLRERKFEELLEGVAANRMAGKVRRSPEDESSLHYSLKAFLVYYFIKKEGIPPEGVETEFELGGARADVYVKPRKLAVEVETFYGTGASPWWKLEETIEKYKRVGAASEVWIVIPPLQAMLYLKDLAEKAKELKKENLGFIKLCTVNLHKEKPVPIEEVVRELRKLFAKPRKREARRPESKQTLQ
ncbi:MAG: hypothetical protein ACP5KA_07240 [Desulfurococcaceae archaeon]